MAITPPDERIASENSGDEHSANRRAVLAHNLIAWQEEAERWRKVAHAQRARITELERQPAKLLVRDLISALEEARAFVLHADSRWQEGRKTRALDLLDQILRRGKEWLHGPVA